MEERSELFSIGNTSSFLKKNFLLVILTLGGVLMLVVSSLQFFSQDPNSGIEFVPAQTEIEAERIFVDISGAVKNPGVYEFSREDRIADAIDASGGFAVNADTEYISKNVNQAQRLTDGMKLYFPSEGETVQTILGSSAEQVDEGIININSASQNQLETLPGIGPVRASDIISGRPYNSVDELLIRKVVGPSVFDQIKDLVTAP